MAPTVRRRIRKHTSEAYGRLKGMRKAIHNVTDILLSTRNSKIPNHFARRHPRQTAAFPPAPVVDFLLRSKTMSFNMDGSPRRVRCILRRAAEAVEAAKPEVDLVELKNVILRALMPFREAHMAVANALRARWPEQLRFRNEKLPNEPEHATLRPEPLGC